MTNAATEGAGQLADREVAAAGNVHGALEHGVIGVCWKRQRVGQGLVEFEQGRVDLKCASETREAVFDRDQLPELVLPTLCFGFRAADDSRKSRQNEDRKSVV